MNILSGADLGFYLMTHGDAQTASDIGTLGHAYLAGIGPKSLTVETLDAATRLLKIIMQADPVTKKKLVDDLRSLIS